jgi:hypothetical protein
MSPAKLCPKHGKPYPCGPCRKESAARPPQQPPASIVVEPPVTEPMPEIVVTPRKRGRPPKFTSNAKKQAAYRARLEAEADDAERRNLVAELMRIYGRQESVVVDGRNKRAAEDRRGVARVQKRLYFDHLKQLSIEELRTVLSVQEQTPDSRGRLHGERSGEDRRSDGMSEIEQIIAAQQHDASNFENGEQDPKLAAGFRVKPEGAGPDSDSDSTADAADNIRGGSAKPDYEPTADDKWLQKAVGSIIRKMVYDPEHGARCLFCDEAFAVETAAENHLLEQYTKGKKDFDRYLEHMYLIAGLNSDPSMPGRKIWVDAEPRGLPYQHYKGINREIDSVRKASRKKPRRKNIVTTEQQAA